MEAPGALSIWLKALTMRRLLRESPNWIEPSSLCAHRALASAVECGEKVETTGIRSSPLDTATFVYPKNNSVLVSEVATFDRPQFAANYVSDVTKILLSCPDYFVSGLDGKTKIRIDVTDPGGQQPITDYVSRVFQPKDRSSYDVRTVFQVGSSVVTFSPCFHVFHTLYMNGSIDTARTNDPTVEIWLPRVKPSSGM